ncbi:MAG: exodeoxyribonuclease VII large subunit [Calditrichaceae bacterium]|nr:exodeoxyribonuclease VII large subunit [Calditrichia bacterium]NUQ40504.1 exodeoxyribonuclease VII large subunit [Calditrichaceae bacterium]
MNLPVYSVSQLTREIKDLLENSFPRLWVEGEISNFKRHTSGHLYFTLKDEGSQVNCAMWRFRAGSLLFQPQNGMKILVEGDVQVYEKGGYYQLVVQQMQPAGVGALQMAFEQLKKKLHSEGLFDEAHKKQIPRYPERVGVITSPTGAAIRDIISVMARRFPGVEILLYPVKVQGEGAAAEIARAIADFNEYGGVDTLIVGRGGGSLEDLWAFNEEIVARAIYASRIPVISAVGHEIDYSIADFVADRRAPTPSAAAEMAVPARSEVAGELGYYREKLTVVITRRIGDYRGRLAAFKTSYAFRRPQDLVHQKMQRLDELQRNLALAMIHQLKFYRSRLEHLQQQLRAVNPTAILNRGYSICYKDGEVIKEAARLQPRDRVKIRLARGAFEAEVQRTEETS